jgi:hypothetical protein
MHSEQATWLTPIVMMDRLEVLPGTSHTLRLQPVSVDPESLKSSCIDYQRLVGKVLYFPPESAVNLSEAVFELSVECGQLIPADIARGLESMVLEHRLGERGVRAYSGKVPNASILLGHNLLLEILKSFANTMEPVPDKSDEGISVFKEKSTGCPDMLFCQTEVLERFDMYLAIPALHYESWQARLGSVQNLTEIFRLSSELNLGSILFDKGKKRLAFVLPQSDWFGSLDYSVLADVYQDLKRNEVLYGY